MTLHPVILAGGSGTRLWPLSREHYPKQFLPLMGDKTMFQETVLRLDGIQDVAAPVIVCNEVHRFLVAEQARAIAKDHSKIILEPAGRNTAPALTLAALSVLEADEASDSDPVLLVMPADHVVHDVPAFQEAVVQGTALAESGHLVTFGVVPDAPRTGYGYVKKGVTIDSAPLEARGNGGARTASPSKLAPCQVAAFVEKPDLERAKAFLESGEYLWNSGMFMMRASVWLREIGRHRADILEACRKSCELGKEDMDFFRPDAATFESCPGDSIDYAVMERVAGTASANGSVAAAGNGSSPADVKCAVIPLDAGWSDVGAWPALWEERQRDAEGNVVQGDVIARSTRNSLLMGEHHLVAVVGLEDVVVVETPDAVLVASKDRVDEVKEVVARLKAEDRPEQESHRRVHRPWGHYEVVDSGPRFAVKRLTVKPGGALSLQMHHHRAEHWVVVRGTARVTRDGEQFLLTENQSTNVPVGSLHRLENPGTIPLEIIEVQSGSYLGEDDIVRMEDKYNRQR